MHGIMENDTGAFLLVSVTGVLIKRDCRGHWYGGVRGEILGSSPGPTKAKAFAKNVFINQERKSEVRRRSDTVVVLTINDASLAVAGVVFHDSATALPGNRKRSGSGG